MTLNNTTLTLNQYANSQLTSDTSCTWTSSDTSVATVTDTGIIVAVSAGNVTITATDGTNTATCAVTVNAVGGTSWTDVKTSQLYQNANGYIRYADSTYNNSGEISSSAANAMAVYNVQPGDVYKVSLQMMTRFRIGVLPSLTNKVVVDSLWVDPDDTNGSTVINQLKEHEYTVPDGYTYMVIGYWSGTAGQWTDTWNSMTVEKQSGVSASLQVTPPTKTTYNEGETIDTTGMEVKVVWSDGTEEVVQGWTVDDIAYTAGTNTVTVRYAGLSTTFEITVVFTYNLEDLINTTQGMKTGLSTDFYDVSFRFLIDSHIVTGISFYTTYLNQTTKYNSFSLKCDDNSYKSISIGKYIGDYFNRAIQYGKLKSGVSFLKYCVYFKSTGATHELFLFDNNDMFLCFTPGNNEGSVTGFKNPYFRTDEGDILFLENNPSGNQKVIFNPQSDVGTQWSVLYGMYDDNTEFYTITFIDWNGEVIETQTVASGNSAIAPVSPTRDGYEFTGWDIDFGVVTADLIVTATYVQLFTITFVDGFDGTVLSTQTVQSGSSVTAPSIPIHEHYTSQGWDTDFSVITSDLTVTCTYVENQKYTVTFKDWDESVLKEQLVYVGEPATAPNDPEREGYSFTGWDVDFSNIIGDLTVTAQYEVRYKTYQLGVNVTGILDLNTYELVVSGTGNMTNFTSSNYLSKSDADFKKIRNCLGPSKCPLVILCKTENLKNLLCCITHPSGG